MVRRPIAARLTIVHVDKHCNDHNYHMTVFDTPAARPTSARRWPTHLALIAILLIGAYLRLLSIFAWDEPSTRLHPDERFFADVASTLQTPSSFGEYLDSARNPLNPRNYSKSSWFVYGLLPQTLTQFTAVALTPQSALPACVPRPDATPVELPIGKPCGDPRTGDIQNQIANNDLNVPKLTLLQRVLNPEGRDLTTFWEIHKVGRIWSVIFDLGSILLTFLIGRRLYGRRAALLAALFMAFAVLPIQLAHFFTVDAATGFFVLLAIYWGVRCSQNGGLLSFAALGLSIGGAMACRVTLATLGVVGVLAVAMRLWNEWTDDEHPTYEESFWSLAARRSSLLWLLVLAGLVSVFTFRLLQPDAFVGTNFFDLRPEPRFIENIQRIAAFVSGEADAPPNQQWAGRVPYLFPLQNIVLWGLGLPLGLAALVGWAAAGWQILRRRQLTHLIPWAWITFYFVWQGGQFVTTMRYFSSLYGLLAVLAAWVLIQIADFRLQIADSRRKSTIYNLQSAIYLAPIVAVVLGTALWAYAFTRIYTHPHSRLEASRWIYDNIPAGATITSEQWDDGLPLGVDGRDGSRYVNLQMYPYAEDEPSKYFGRLKEDGTYEVGLLDQLDQADYLVFSSNRVYDSTSRLPMKYPALTRYYHALFEGQLGFELVADVHSYPRLFGIDIPTPVLAEEAFSVYDHPRVLIFKKTPEYSRELAENLITRGVAWEEVYKVTSYVGHRTPTALRLTAAQWPAYLAGGANVLPSLLGSLAPWLVWLLVLELVGLAAFALVFHMLPGLPDRGFTLSKTLGLLVVAWVAWLLASLGAGDGRPIMLFSPASVWLCAALLLVPGALVAWQTRTQLRAFWHERRRALISAEALFLVAFFGFLVLRAINPDLWHPARGGEKPMDLAFLTATLRSAAFPPYDPWFAGGYINYYYFGFVFVGALVHLSGVAPTVAYNLAVPTLFALTALGAFGIGFNLIARKSQGKETRGQGQGETRRRGEALGLPLLPYPSLPVSRSPGLPVSRIPRDRRAIVTGIVAAVFVVLIGPLTQAVWFLPGTADANDEGISAECRAESSYAAQQECRGRSEWAFWDATRLVGTAISERTGAHDSTITEFPFFTFLFADLHAHMIALPLALLALGLMLAVARSVQFRVSSEKSSRSFPIYVSCCILSLALATGALAATNTWDYPAYLGLGVLTLGLVAWRRWRLGQSLVLALGWWALGAVALVVLSRLLFLPFHQSFATEYAGFERWSGEGTGTAEFLKINGLWLFLLLVGVLTLYRRLRGTSLTTLVLAGVAAVAISLALALRGVPALLLLVPMLSIAAGALGDLLFGQRRPGSARASLATLLPVLWACAAIGLCFLTEVIVAKGDIGRMNTVFKLGMQSWTLFALASSVAFVNVFGRRTEDQGRMASPARTFVLRPWLLVQFAAVALVAAGLVYPLTATPARLADRFDRQIAPTLDGTAYMESPNARWGENGQDFALADDADALAWMRREISGAPVVLEAQTEGYRWGGRVSIYTGLPTLLGWPWHETQQRNVAHAQPVLDARRALVSQLYDTTDEAAALETLRTYGVEYIYVGKLEYALYNASGLAKFERMFDAGTLERVYDAGETRIYRVPDLQNPPAIVTTSLPVVAPVLPPEKAAMLDRPVEQLPVVDEYAWNPLAQSQPVAVLLWLLAWAALALLGMPLAVLLFSRWRDGGVAFAPLIGLLLLGYAVWLPVSAGLWKYDRVGLLLGAALVLAVDVVVIAALGRMAEDGGPRTVGLRRSTVYGLRSVGRHLHARLRSAALGVGMFLAAFGVFVVIRMLNPDLWQPFWGGEKPFEFGFLNAILRSPVMPPYNPFYSDGTINYYYYGLFLVSLPLKAIGVAPAVGFNLILPTLYGLTLVGAFSIARQLTGRVGYGLLGAAFVGVCGNLAAVFQNLGSAEQPLPSIQVVLAALREGLPGLGDRLDSWFIGPSRVIPYTINEFPFWSFLFADLHPHLIALPITLLVIALAYTALEGRRKKYEGGRTSGAVHTSYFFLLTLALGALAVTNSWDFPTYVLLSALALAAVPWLDRRATGWALAGRVVGAVAQAGAVAGAALLLYMPFFQNFKAMVGGVGFVRGGTAPASYAMIYGLFLVVLLPALLAALWRVAVVARPSAVMRQVFGIVARPPALRRYTPFALGALIALLPFVVLVQPENPIVLKLLLGALLVGSVVLLLNRRLSSTTWFALALAALGFAVSLGIDTIYIRDHLAGDPANPGDWYRMNTVFKFGMQIWTLLALAAVALLPVLLRGLRRLHPLAEIGVGSLVLVVTALALVFPLVGTPSRVAYRFSESPGPTLDGLAFLDDATYQWNEYTIDLRDDGEAIRWLNTTIKGTPVVLQSSMEFYRAYGVRVAANTGLPTVVSPLHESEQRDGQLVADRDEDVITFYRTNNADQALRLLSKYHVGYVYVGPIERAAYGEQGMAKFQQLSGSYLSPVFQNTSVTIYKVNESVYSLPFTEGGVSVITIPPQPVPQAPVDPAPPADPAGQPTLAELEQLNTADPSNAGAAFGLGQRYRDLGRLDEAASVLGAAAAANPDDVPLHHLWGDTLRDAGRDDEAENAYRAAAQAKPDSGNYNKLGVELLRMQRFEAAEIALNEAIRLDAQVAEPYFHLGELYAQQNKREQAAENYTRYLSLAPAGQFSDQAKAGLAGVSQ